jgi:elongation factor G
LLISLCAVEVEIEPEAENHRARLDSVFDRLILGEPRIGIRRDPESGQMFVLANSGPEIDYALSWLTETYKVHVRAGALLAAYRETPAKPVTVLHTHRKLIGGAGEFAELKIAFEPLPRGSGFVFKNEASGGTLLEDHIAGVEAGLKFQMESGVLAGFPVIDFQARLLDGKYHEIDSRTLTFETAARAAFRDTAIRGAVKMLEPIMKIEVVTPDEHFGNVIRVLNLRGQIEGTNSHDDGQVVTAMVPMGLMFDFSDALGTATQGRGRYAMTYDHHGDMPWRDGDPRFPSAAAMRLA